MDLKELTKVQDSQRIGDMANIGKKYTGLNNVVHLTDKTNMTHGPRVKVYVGRPGVTPCIEVTVEDEPKIKEGDVNLVRGKDWKRLCKWIRKNKELILQFWENPQTVLLDDFKKV